ncbi:MAG: hypothetical protein Q4D98_07395 [Planctomycetia bacterium]|nr:hypothetical protein [Planctomycetia bacterium]
MEIFDGNSYPEELLELKAPHLYAYTKLHGAMFSEEVFLKDVCPKFWLFSVLVLLSVMYLRLFLINFLYGGHFCSFYFDLFLAFVAFLNVVFAFPFLLRYVLFYDVRYPLRTVFIEHDTAYVTELGSCQTITHFSQLALKETSFINGDSLFTVPRYQKCFLVNVRHGVWIAVGIHEESFKILKEYASIRSDNKKDCMDDEIFTSETGHEA